MTPREDDKPRGTARGTAWWAPRSSRLSHLWRRSGEEKFLEIVESACGGWFETANALEAGTSKVLTSTCAETARQHAAPRCKNCERSLEAEERRG